MGRWHRHITFNPERRVGSLLVTLATAPALALSPLATQAIVIHDHHGHDTHGHTLALHELDDWQENPEHQHEHRDHDGLPADPTGREGPSTLIVVDLPEALARGRAVSGCTSTVAVAGTPSALPVHPLATAATNDNRPYLEGSSPFAHGVRAHGLLEAILLTSNALLL